MAAVALPGNLAEVMVEGVADAGGGALLRLAWDRSDNIGMIATGGFILGGLILPMFGGRGQMGGLLDTASKAMFHSGATIAGWLTTEKVFNLEQPAAARALPPGARRRALRPPVYAPTSNGVTAPGVAISGRNPNTGEEILDSRI